ncbi:hypothetical protein [uncultured Microbacterium sp.]|uniref:hypothetical protein n=1 Tax=uncultured Microbacterium sp. TaxID=191216 RepID=UPI0026180F4A|nr:hypothetical protein [uncultured Microbacterium sp.]
MPFPRLVVGSTALLVSVAALTACSATTGPQSTQDACGVLAEGLGNVQEQVTAADTALLAGDMTTAQSNLASASAGLYSVSPQITNEQISPILDDLITGLNDVHAAAEPDAAPEALDAASSGLRDAVERFNEPCGG